MGIEYYFARIPADDLVYLRQHQTRQAIAHIFERADMEVSFSPSDEEESVDAARRIGMERDFWLLLRDLVALPDDAPPLWKQQETDSPKPDTTIGDVWMGYSPLYFLTPEQVKHSIALLDNVTHADLSERFAHEFVRYDDMNDRQKESLRLTILACFDDLSQLLNQAVTHNEALVWYIG